MRLFEIVAVSRLIELSRFSSAVVVVAITFIAGFGQSTGSLMAQESADQTKPQHGQPQGDVEVPRAGELRVVKPASQEADAAGTEIEARGVSPAAQRGLPGGLGQQAAMLDEIARIRQRLGGGVSESFRAFDPRLVHAAEEEFNRQLREQAEGDSPQNRLNRGGGQRERNPFEAPAQPEPTGPWAEGGPQRAGPRSVGLQQRDGWGRPDEPRNQNERPSERPNAGPRRAMPERWEYRPAGPSQLERLRGVARRLEEMAAELEEGSLFEEADEMREQAVKLWRRARQLAPPSRGR